MTHTSGLVSKYNNSPNPSSLRIVSKPNTATQEYHKEVHSLQNTCNVDSCTHWVPIFKRCDNLGLSLQSCLGCVSRNPHQAELRRNVGARVFMHQAIPGAPYSLPRATAGHLPVSSVPGGDALDNLACPGGRALANPGDTPKNFSRFLKVCFLNINMYFNLKSHNFKANSESAYKLSPFATSRI